ncbi:MAG: CocE/NonD family hydrolase [Gemmatimonadetes bacterium]|nr:CocE/NonD family hydrolase [Gemmatimonadota bacterium]
MIGRRLVLWTLGLALGLSAALLLPAGALPAQQAQVADRFSVMDTMIPTRDGVRLHTKILVPKNQSGPLPFVMKRTPYGIEGWQGNFVAYFKDLADEGYIFVFQDIRGRYRSEGTFVMQRPARSPGDAKAIDEGTDTYDTIDWLLKHVPNHNGRVGILGVSYDGWTTIMGALEPHPGLKAISPQASPADMWLGEDFHHNGAFRLSYGFEYAARMETSKEQTQFEFDRYDTYDWYLELGPLSNVNLKYLMGKIPTWNDYVAHPDYDEFWKRQTLIPHLKSATVPALNVAGWWDQEDFYGPIRIYDELEKHDTQGINYLVVGPWNHGGWSRGTGDKLGPISFDNPTSQYFREQVQAPFFAFFLKDKGSRNFPEALTFEAGSNQWRRWDAWPPKRQTDDRNLYFHPDGRLSFDAPAGGSNAFDAYVSDPAHPVPYRHRPIPATYFPGGSGWPTWLVEDQRFVKHRPDVLSYESEPLTEDVTIAGDVVARLFAATTGTDADWVVKLIDVYPERYPENWSLAGNALMVSNEVFRGRYRTGFERPVAIPRDSVLEYSWSLHTQNYTFKRGHRIMVQVQSTWFPIIDRNPQTFVPNIFEAKETDFQRQAHRIYRAARFPSHVTVPVVRP